MCKGSDITPGAWGCADGNVNGFGLEFYIETPEAELIGGMHEVKQSWQFQLLYTVSQLAAGPFILCNFMKQPTKPLAQLKLEDVGRGASGRIIRGPDTAIQLDVNLSLQKFPIAGHGGIRAIMDDMRLLSTEAEGVQEAIPDSNRQGLVNSAGRVGALLGLKPHKDDVVQNGEAFMMVLGLGSSHLGLACFVC